MFKTFTQNIYHYMLLYLPTWVMYKHIYIDTQHKLWVPRWGSSKKQILAAEAWAEKMFTGITWE